MSASNNNKNTTLGYKQIANVKRRAWDTETYEKKAKLRQEQQQEDVSNDDNTNSNRKKSILSNNNNTENVQLEEFIPASANAIGPDGSDRAYLKARTHRVIGIDNKIGSTEILSIDSAFAPKVKKDKKLKSNKNNSLIINDDNDTTTNNATFDSSTTITNTIAGLDQGISKTGIGWYCQVCDCYLRDSHTYLDHINGRKHQRALGYTMHVERSTKEQVLYKLQQLSSIPNVSTTSSAVKNDTVNLQQLVQEKDNEEKERQRLRKERKLLKKKMKHASSSSSINNADDSNNINENNNERDRNTSISNTAIENGSLPIISSLSSSIQGTSTASATTTMTTSTTDTIVEDTIQTVIDPMPRKQEENELEIPPQQQEEDYEDDDDDNNNMVNPALAAMMGFSSFG